MASDSSETIVKGDINDCAKMMKKMVNNKEFSDIKFVIGTNRKTIFAHRCILAARCAVFKAMFNEKSNAGDKDVPFVLSDMSPDIFLSIMEYLYTNCVSLSLKNATDVLATALEYGLDDLRNICVEFLSQNLTSYNACDIMQAAVTYKQKDLKEHAIAYIQGNTGTVFKSKGFQEISEETLVSILRSSKLNMDEIDLYRAVKEWATVNSVVHGKKINEVAKSALQHIRFPLLSPEELSALDEENKKDNFIPVNCFVCAWRTHALKQGEKDNVLTVKRKGTSPRDHHKYLQDNTSAK